jgi:hypothetical protein
VGGRWSPVHGTQNQLLLFFLSFWRMQWSCNGSSRHLSGGEVGDDVAYLVDGHRVLPGARRRGADRVQTHHLIRHDTKARTGVKRGGQGKRTRVTMSRNGQDEQAPKEVHSGASCGRMMMMMMTTLPRASPSPPPCGSDHYSHLPVLVDEWPADHARLEARVRLDEAHLKTTQQTP